MNFLQHSVRHAIALASLVLCLASTSLAHVGPNMTQHAGFLVMGYASVTPRQQQSLTAAQAAKIAQARHGGKVLSVERVETDKGVRYRVKLLQDNGRVKTVMIDG